MTPENTLVCVCVCVGGRAGAVFIYLFIFIYLFFIYLFFVRGLMMPRQASESLSVNIDPLSLILLIIRHTYEYVFVLPFVHKSIAKVVEVRYVCITCLELPSMLPHCWALLKRLVKKPWEDSHKNNTCGLHVSAHFHYLVIRLQG